VNFLRPACFSRLGHYFQLQRLLRFYSRTIENSARTASKPGIWHSRNLYQDVIHQRDTQHLETYSQSRLPIVASIRHSGWQGTHLYLYIELHWRIEGTCTHMAQAVSSLFLLSGRESHGLASFATFELDALYNFPSFAIVIISSLTNNSSSSKTLRYRNKLQSIAASL